MPHRQYTDLTVEQQHVAIIGCCDDLLTAVADPLSHQEIGQLRAKLAALLHANLASEEAQLIGPIRRLAANARPPRFLELSAEAADLRSRYSEHVGQWTRQMIESDHETYARAAAELVACVKSHLNRKRAVLADWKHAAVNAALPRA